MYFLKAREASHSTCAVLDGARAEIIQSISIYTCKLARTYSKESLGKVNTINQQVKPKAKQ